MNLLVSLFNLIWQIFAYWTSWIIALSFALYYCCSKGENYWKKRGLDGEEPLSLIGTLLSMLTPLPILQQKLVTKYGKFFGGYRRGKPVMYIVDPNVIKRILVQDFHLFRNRIYENIGSKATSAGLVFLRDEQWKRVRSILTPMFTSSKLRRMESKMSYCTRSLLNILEQQLGNDNETIITVRNMMGNFTMDVIAQCAFATDTNAHVDPNNQFVRNARQLFSVPIWKILLFSILPAPLIRKLRELSVPGFRSGSSDFFQDFCKHMIEQRTKETIANGSRHHDMLQLLINAQLNQNDSNNKATIFEQQDLLEAHHVNSTVEEMKAEERELGSIIGTKSLSEEEVIAQSLIFLLAGYETTASAMSYCLFELAVQSDVQSRLYKEVQDAKERDPKLCYETIQSLPFLDAVLTETLRKYPPALFVDRECTSEQGYYIPECNYKLSKGDGLQFPVYAIHHCPEFYPEPDQFNPDRFMGDNRNLIQPYTYLPFGGGPRNCIGMRFALVEAKIGLANLIDRFELFQSKRTPNQLKITVGTVLLKTEPIYVGIRRRQV
ncbi:hypothetical protein BLOT_001766 [Blomia tropicalis]|nr:hypothetical protein BLOT_001766 [Blomia tropicalis]